MDDLTAFLAARLDEDEAQARDATAEPGMAAEWHETTSGCLDVGLPDHGGEDWRDYVWPQGDSRVTRFIARHDPARVLREVEAKRNLIAAILTAPHHNWRGISACRKVMDAEDACNCGRDAHAGQLLRILAAVDSDHPDYQAEWKL